MFDSACDPILRRDADLAVVADECPWDEDAWPAEVLDDVVDASYCGSEHAPTPELLEHLLTVTPGSVVMSALARIDRSQLSGEDAVTFLRVHERVSAWWKSVQAEVLVAAASPERLVEEYTLLVPDSDEDRTIRIDDAVREEVAAALRWSPITAQQCIDTARLLAGPLSATRSALAAGDITSGHVNVIVESAVRLPGRWLRDDTERETFTAACTELQRRVLPTATRGTISATRAAGKRAVLAIDAEGERRRREQAKCTRDVWVSDQLDGITLLVARMATEHAHAVLTQLDAHAHAMTTAAAGDEGETIGERRVQALTALVLGGDPTRPAPVRAHLDIVVDLDTLLGLADNAVEVRGADPVSADVLRDLLADPEVALTMRRLVTDPVTGHLLDYGRRSYQVPQRLRDYITARDRTCRFPGCHRRADRCQLDHATAWDDGGQTNPQNVGALCTRHHQLKTHAGWDITDSRPDGSCSWRSPQGRESDHDPPPY